jgi:hypothetical protein
LNAAKSRLDVRQEDGHVDDLLERAARVLEDRLHVLDARARLRLDPFRDLLGLAMPGPHPGEEEEIADPPRVRIRTERARRAAGDDGVHVDILAAPWNRRR